MKSFLIIFTMENFSNGFKVGLLHFRKLLSLLFIVVSSRKCQCTWLFVNSHKRTMLLFQLGAICTGGKRKNVWTITVFHFPNSLSLSDYWLIRYTMVKMFVITGTLIMKCRLHWLNKRMLTIPRKFGSTIGTFIIVVEIVGKIKQIRWFMWQSFWKWTAKLKWRICVW